MSAHSLLEHSAYSESWSPSSRTAFKVILIISMVIGLSGIIGFFSHQAGIHNGGGGDWSISTLAS